MQEQLRVQNQILKTLLSSKIKAVCTVLNSILSCLSSMRDFIQGSNSPLPNYTPMAQKKHIIRQRGHNVENYHCLQWEFMAGMRSSLGISNSYIFPSCHPQPCQLQTFQFVQQMKHGHTAAHYFSFLSKATPAEDKTGIL